MTAPQPGMTAGHGMTAPQPGMTAPQHGRPRPHGMTAARGSAGAISGPPQLKSLEN